MKKRGQPPISARLAPAAVVLVALAACGPRAAEPPVLADPAALSPDVRVEHAVAFRMGDRELLGRGVVVKRGGRLDVFLLAPGGTRLARFSQVGDRVESDVRVEGLDRLDPRWLLHDVRFAFLPAGPTGPYTVTERRDDAGDPVERRVEGAGIAQTVTLSDWTGEGPGRHPRRVRVRHESPAYTLDLAVEAWQPL